ncbi:tRNA lysidine(34) synthetase TilS [Halalkalibacillus sediminis]|uniref:tRNA(Ile)-lysidine synthase n=1 Tax=Halalkalibacillus sediminis TaxID=2018042 RepID=A0A2I0QT66_9BACI|nr:tRNA lysidine(34) synthetase TilS [Halalkalibacillus sediminis]PKR77516.1 tRNA lysidine(34) synthetase TilS [Halalkalibacillus sediminis]
MKDRVLGFNKENHLFQPGDTLFLAVSGGPDSLAMLHFFAGIREEWELDLIVLTIDHQLRGIQSAEDTEFVEEYSSNLGIKCEVGKVDVKKLMSEAKMGTQEAARELRYQFFYEKMQNYPSGKLVFAHHGDDQVETTLMQLIKGQYPNGTPVKRAFGSHMIIRPFLSLSKKEILDYVEEHELNPRIDPSNEDESYTRNRMRSTVIPLLHKENPNLVEGVQRVHEFLSEDDAYLYQISEDKVREISTFCEQKVTFSINSFQKMPLSLQRRGFHLILNYLKVNALFRNNNFLAFSEWLQSQHSNSVMTLFDDVIAIKAYDTCIIQLGSIHTEPFQRSLHMNQSLELPNHWTVSVRESNEWSGSTDQAVVSFDQLHLQFPLKVRTRQDGDRIKPLGLNGTKKVKDIFIDHKIPLYQRDQWPLLVNGDGEVLWIPFVCKSRLAQPDKHSSVWVSMDIK